MIAALDFPIKAVVSLRQCIARYGKIDRELFLRDSVFATALQIQPGEQPAVERIVAVLISAHLIADFLLQPKGLVQKKDRLEYLAIHALIHAAVAYILLQQWSLWIAPLAVFLFHGLIDALKQFKGNRTAGFFIFDQLLHLISLLLLSWLIISFTDIKTFTGAEYRIIVISAGFIVTVFGVNHLLVLIMKELFAAEEYNTLLDPDRKSSLAGQVERALVYIFILTGFPFGLLIVLTGKGAFYFFRRDKAKFKLSMAGSALSISLAALLSLISTWALTF